MKDWQREKHGERLLKRQPPLFFAPRWISRYIVRSIELCGDMSLAYDLWALTAKEESA